MSRAGVASRTSISPAAPRSKNQLVVSLTWVEKTLYFDGSPWRLTVRFASSSPRSSARPPPYVRSKTMLTELVCAVTCVPSSKATTRQQSGSVSAAATACAEPTDRKGSWRLAGNGARQEAGAETDEHPRFLAEVRIHPELRSTVEKRTWLMKPTR